MIRPDEATIEAATKESWAAMFRDQPEKDWDVMNSEYPEIIDAHRRMVRAAFAAEFNPEQSVRIATDGRYQYEDMLDTGKKFQKELCQFLRRWWDNQ